MKKQPRSMSKKMQGEIHKRIQKQGNQATMYDALEWMMWESYRQTVEQKKRKRRGK